MPEAGTERSMSDAQLADLLADAADAITLARFGSLDLEVRSKPDRTPVTDADTAVEDTIREMLARARPDDMIAGEERGGDIPASGRAWVVDPIDGTKNFLRGVPAWATLIALVDDGVPIAGVVSSPALGKRWGAEAGGGAWVVDSRGRRPISVSKVAKLDDTYMSTTDIQSWREFHREQAYLDLVHSCWVTRAFGDFWQHCLVAEGAIDLAAEAVVNPWDVAVIQLLVTEAGGRFSDINGNPGFLGGSGVSSNGLVHEAALNVLNAGRDTND